ncbi:hypothetical protein BK026_08975 [Alteromonas sp. V450]|uniref:hypothetical protein n=1 Tax=Alteromonas sp. V450 TaxID=1912139 RepID=UPI0008FF3A97|nr:hypothetical protein [Alteromonas sp. V450]OJF68913.1 hypothetical protein BK026_08975 [Alteromonas sp. V450]|tara:strand:- start:1606 stop:1809 length:204 start_codon:yes stop_codon:yes gene_type:complete
MAKSIIDFLVALDTDSKLLESYKKDPVGTAQSYGLAEKDIQLIKEQNWDELSRRYDDTGRAIRIIHY